MARAGEMRAKSAWGLVGQEAESSPARGCLQSASTCNMRACVGLAKARRGSMADPRRGRVEHGKGRGGAGGGSISGLCLWMLIGERREVWRKGRLFRNRRSRLGFVRTSLARARKFETNPILGLVGPCTAVSWRIFAPVGTICVPTRALGVARSIRATLPPDFGQVPSDPRSLTQIVPNEQVSSPYKAAKGSTVGTSKPEIARNHSGVDRTCAIPVESSSK